MENFLIAHRKTPPNESVHHFVSIVFTRFHDQRTTVRLRTSPKVVLTRFSRHQLSVVCCSVIGMPHWVVWSTFHGGFLSYLLGFLTEVVAFRASLGDNGEHLTIALGG